MRTKKILSGSLHPAEYKELFVAYKDETCSSLLPPPPSHLLLTIYVISPSASPSPPSISLSPG